MSKHLFLSAAVVAAALMFPAIAKAQAPVQNDSLIPFYGDVRGPMCNPTNNTVGLITASTPLDTLLFNHTRRMMMGVLVPAACNPVLAPDGHQMTLGEYQAVQGTAKVKCINTGTHSVLHFSGLQPQGVYSVWLLLVNPAPPPTYKGVGSLGRTELSNNGFMTSAAGEGQLSVTTPEQLLSIDGNPVGPCFLDNVVELHLVYHIDQETHGMSPGPLNAWVVNARFLFP